MKQFDVMGMSCAACSARVEKAVSALAGVESCSVSLLTNSMGVTGTASEKEIIEAVEKAGYSAKAKGTNGAPSAGNQAFDPQNELKQMKIRLVSSFVFLLFLMYLSMGHNMLNLPLPAFLDGNPIANGILQMLLSLSVMVINQKFFINGVKGAVHRSPNMDTLVALGSAASFGYSLYALLAMTVSPENAGHYLHEFYFESAAMILALITVGKLLETYSKGKTTDALKSLMKLSPKTVTVEKDGIETVLPIEQLYRGDVFVVRPGEKIAADGVVIAGKSAVDESALTGESIPVDKSEGDKVSAASINQSGVLKCRAERVGEDTTLSQIIKMVSDAAATKAPIAKIADKVSGVFVPVVITIALATTVIWLALGETVGFALARGISVLVISCPCALGLATPVAIMVGNGKGAKNGILFKTAEALEKLGKVSVVALDKTGTITQGKPSVTDVVAAEDVTEQELIELAVSLEAGSEHPLAKAIVRYGTENQIAKQSVSNFKNLPGNGVSAQIGTDIACGGSLAYISTDTEVPEGIKTQAQALADKGKTPMLFAKNHKLYGMIAVADTMKGDSTKAIKQLQNMGIFVAMITGDNERTAKFIGKWAGVDAVISDVLPDGKAKEVQRLKRKGLVAMVGDGINDAPALTVADVGVAIGAGTDVAIDAAEIVLVNNSLQDVVYALRLSQATIRTIHQNLFWAFFYNVIGIPLAAGAFISLLGWQLNPMFGAAAMSLSSFFVVTNALRLNLVDIRSSKYDRKRKNKRKTEDRMMQKTMKISGMMCPHCEARVKKTLEALPQVEEAVVSHSQGTAVVTLKEELADAVLKSTVEDQGYPVESIQ